MAFSKDWMLGAAMTCAMRIIGSIGQDKKTLNSEGEVEFLRNMYMNDGNVYGYLNRSIPNLITKDM